MSLRYAQFHLISVGVVWSNDTEVKDYEHIVVVIRMAQIIWPKIGKSELTNDININVNLLQHLIFTAALNRKTFTKNARSLYIIIQF